MPNYAFNQLTISGPAELLSDFLERNKGEGQVLSFAMMVPYPEEFRAMDRALEEFIRDHPDVPHQAQPKDGYNSGGYEWCCMAWGTKWDAVDPWVGPYETATGSITIRFDTAWSPPLPWLQVAAERWPDLILRLESEDPSLGWGNEVEFRGGLLVSHRSRDVKDWVEGPDDEGPVWGPWRDVTINPIWEGWPRPEWTPERARTLRNSGLGAWILAEKFGLLPDEEGWLLGWLAANHPERLPLLIERVAELGRRQADDGLVSNPREDDAGAGGLGSPLFDNQCAYSGNIHETSCAA
jgi:hypothetical protein